MPSTPEYTEVVAGTPELLFGAVKDHHEWVPKLVPHVFTDVKRHDSEGEGVDNSVFHYDIHEDKHDVHGGAPKIKLVMDEHDPETLSYSVQYLGDPKYSTLKYHVRFVPGPSAPNTTSVKWRIEYVPYDEKTGAPDDLVATNIPHLIFKDLAAHLEAEKLPKVQ